MQTADIQVIPTVPTHSAQQSFRDVCQAAIRVFNLMDKHHTAPYPNAYAVWFAYTTGANDALVTEVNNLLALKDQLSPYDLESLYQEYLQNDDSSYVAQNIGEAIGNEISSVLEIIETGLKQNDAFNTSLGSFAEQVPQTMGGEGLAAVISGLMEENRRMADMTRQLNEGLAKSQGMIGALNHQLEEVQAQTLRDPVTSIGNRRAFDRHLEAAVARAEKLHTSFCIALGGIDDFNSLVEIYGHIATDATLSKIAAIIAGNVGPEDLAARHGGEVFGLVLENPEIMSAHNLLVKIKHDVKSSVFALENSDEAISGVTVSFGLVRYEHGMSAPKLMEQAGACLLDARRSGRNLIKGTGLS